MRASDELEETLQALFCLEEGGDGPFSEEQVLAWSESGPEALQRAVESGLATGGPDGFRLTERGRPEAAVIVRRHRLAERLLHDVLRMTAAASESAACKFEHILEREVTESICTLLGHPLVCPHGKPIPRGACCTSHEHQIRAVIQKLSELHAGDDATIAYVQADNDARIDRLSSFGLMPGTPLRVHQMWPSVVIEFAGTHLALDRETADDIFVRIAEPPREEADAHRGHGRGRRKRFWQRG
jgi:DtxR family Mn-dependent transcriptional regulator